MLKYAQERKEPGTCDVIKLLDTSVRKEKYDQKITDCREISYFYGVFIALWEEKIQHQFGFWKLENIHWSCM